LHVQQRETGGLGDGWRQRHWRGRCGGAGGGRLDRGGVGAAQGCARCRGGEAKRGGKAEALALDVSNKSDVNKAAQQILNSHGRIDLLVNSAGINVPKRSWADMELEGWDRLVEINLNGVLYCMRAVLPAMRQQQDGCIINVASWAGRHVSKMPGPPTPPPSTRCSR
jgi:NAD(P)-dependent dehydrogenase (short-subunit alcohol dehydrogenase family)